MRSEARDLNCLDIPFDDDAPPSRPSLRSVGGAVGDDGRESSARWLADVGEMPAHLLGGLPVPLTLRMRAVDGSAFHVSSSAAQQAVLQESGAIVLSCHEWDTVVLATEADRAWPADLVRSLRVRGSSGQLSVDALLDGITVEQARRDTGRLSTIARVLARLGARLDAVWLDEPAVPQGTADRQTVAA